MKQILDKIEVFLLCFTVFAIPVHIKVTSISIAFLVIIALLKKENYALFVKMFKNPKFYILVLPYLFFFTGLLNTSNTKEGFMQIEITASLLVFPIIFSAIKSNGISKRWELILSFFILGVLLSYFVCLSVAIPAYLTSKDFNVFFYQVFSDVIKGPHHLSYCVIFAIAILISNFYKQTVLPEIISNRLKIILILVLTIFLFQLSSKATILLYLAFILFVFLYSLIKRQISIKIGIPIIVFVIILTILGFSIKKVHMRFEKFIGAVENRREIDPRSQESTAMRIAAFKAGTQIAMDNFWFGTGTGDLLPSMREYYKGNNFQGAYIQNISPHNQFVRTFAMLGIFAFVSLIAVFVLMAIVAVKEKHFLMMFWIFIMLVLFNVEDMLAIQDGVILFCFFTPYFILNPKETNR